MTIRKLFLSFFSGMMFFCMACLASSDGQFVLPKQKTKKLSKNELKESVGQELRDAFTVTTNVAKSAGKCQVTMGQMHDVGEKIDSSMRSLQKTFGSLHIELAQLQQKFSRLVECLIDDQKPFKHAGREQLQGALSVVQNVGKGLKTNESQLLTLEKRLEKIASAQEDGKTLANIAKNAADTVSDIKESLASINSCQGLRVS